MRYIFKGYKEFYKDLLKIFNSDNKTVIEWFYSLHKQDFFKDYMPEIEAMFDCEQYSVWHDKTVIDHTLSVINNLPIGLKVVGLFHDSGKPVVKSHYKYGDEEMMFDGTELSYINTLPDGEINAPCTKRYYSENGKHMFIGHAEESKKIFNKYAELMGIDDREYLSKLIQFHELSLYGNKHLEISKINKIDREFDTNINRFIEDWGIFRLADVKGQSESWHKFRAKENKFPTKLNINEINTIKNDLQGGFKMTDYELIKEALAIAEYAYEGQVDKAGRVYIFHPVTVALLCTDTKTKVAALLHDTLEDHPDKVSYEMLCKRVGKDVADAVKLLTHEKIESDDEQEKENHYLDYVKQLKNSGNEIAIQVKKADLTNNMDLSRLVEVNEKDLKRVEKYKKAYEILLN